MGQILVVEDHIDTCRVMARLLRRSGHDAQCAYSGEQAMAYLALSRPLPDLVLLDAMMPGMDGAEVLRRLRSDPRTAPLAVVMCSAVSDPTFIAHALQKGANDYLVKSTFGLEDLLARIKPFLPEPEPANCGRRRPDAG